MGVVPSRLQAVPGNLAMIANDPIGAFNPQNLIPAIRANPDFKANFSQQGFKNLGSLFGKSVAAGVSTGILAGTALAGGPGVLPLVPDAVKANINAYSSYYDVITQGNWGGDINKTQKEIYGSDFGKALDSLSILSKLTGGKSDLGGKLGSNIVNVMFRGSGQTPTSQIGRIGAPAMKTILSGGGVLADVGGAALTASDIIEGSSMIRGSMSSTPPTTLRAVNASGAILPGSYRQGLIPPPTLLAVK